MRQPRRKGDWVAVYRADQRGLPHLDGIGRVESVIEVAASPDGGCRGGVHLALAPYSRKAGSWQPAAGIVVGGHLGGTAIVPLTAERARSLLSDDRPGVRELALRAVVELGRRA